MIFRKPSAILLKKVRIRIYLNFSFQAEDSSKGEEIQQGTLRDLVQRPLIRQTTLIIMANQFVRGIINYGFLFNIGTIGGDIFTNNILNNITGIPGKWFDFL